MKLVMLRGIFHVLCLLVPSILCAQGLQFRRGDSNLDGLFDISDPIKSLNVLFIGAPSPGCDDAMDADDSGSLDLSDGIYSFGSLFTGGPSPPAPFAACGADPTADALGCANSPLCPPAECLEEADLDGAIDELVARELCVPGDAFSTVVLTLTVTVCPKASARPCGPEGLPGCLVALTVLEGTLNVPGKKATVHVEGKMDDFPIDLDDGLNPAITCTFDITFKGDVVIPIQTGPDGAGGLKLTAILAPAIENVTLNAVPSPGFLCAAISSQKDQLIPEVKKQLEAAAAELLVGLREDFAGQSFCR